MVSQGKEAVAVPDVYNKPQEQATNELTQAGLVVSSTSTAYSDTVAEGNVIEQSIAANKYVDRGTNISIVVSAGSNKAYYFCKATISPPPERDDVVSADITLVGSDGKQIKSWTDEYQSLSLSITDEGGHVRKGYVAGILKSPGNEIYMDRGQMEEIFKESCQVTGGYMEVYGLQNMKKARDELEGGGFLVEKKMEN